MGRLHGSTFGRVGVSRSRGRSREDTRLTFSFLRRQTFSVPSMLILFVSMGSLPNAARTCARQGAAVFRLVHGFPHDSMSVMLPLMMVILVADFCQIIFLAGREVVEHDERYDRGERVRPPCLSDEAAPRDEVAHSGNPPSICGRRAAEDRVGQLQVATAAYDAARERRLAPV